MQLYVIEALYDLSAKFIQAYDNVPLYPHVVNYTFDFDDTFTPRRTGELEIDSRTKTDHE